MGICASSDGPPETDIADAVVVAYMAETPMAYHASRTVAKFEHRAKRLQGCVRVFSRPFGAGTAVFIALSQGLLPLLRLLASQHGLAVRHGLLAHYQRRPPRLIELDPAAATKGVLARPPPESRFYELRHALED